MAAEVPHTVEYMGGQLNFAPLLKVENFTKWKKRLVPSCCVIFDLKPLPLSFDLELALLCVRMFPEESDKIKRYVGGLPDMIYGSVVASKPKTMQKAIEMATEQMDKKIRTFANVRQRTKGSKMITTTKLSNNLPRSKCTIKYVNCKKVGRLTRDCRSPAATNNHRNPTCYECRNQWNYRSDCPKLKNQNHGNQARGTGARGMVHAFGGGEINQDLNNMKDDINA
ncbi:hypothetical protein Tco_1238540 [Tanacetum coccineum]